MLDSRLAEHQAEQYVQDDLRRIVGKVKEESGALQTAVLLEVAGEETSGLQVNTHGGEDDGEVLLVVIMNTLARDTVTLNQTGLPTNLGGDFIVRETGSGENRNLLPTSNRVHGVNSRDTRRDHFLGVHLEQFISNLRPDDIPPATTRSLTLE